MDNNASSAGIFHGGLFNTADIKVLICYILSAVNEPVQANMLVNVLHYEGIANAFEISDAIISLSQSGQIELASSSDEFYIITQSGRDIAKTLHSSLSATIKDRAYLAILKMVSKFKNAKDSTFEITNENGNKYITCSALDGEKPFISIKMLITDEAQGQCIKEKFLEKPSEIYSKIIEMLTK